MQIFAENNATLFPLKKVNSGISLNLGWIVLGVFFINLSTFKIILRKISSVFSGKSFGFLYGDFKVN